MKKRDKSVQDALRAATFDLLAYRDAYAAQVSSTLKVSCLGIAWGAEVRPQASDLVLASPDTIGEALDLVIASVLD